jgi:hypothetical protein
MVIVFSTPRFNMKNNLHYVLGLAAAAMLLGGSSNNLVAQNFDPAQFRERAMTRYREQLDVKSDQDWNKIEPLVGKVMDARTAAGGLGFGGRGGGRRDGGGGGGGGGGNAEQGGNNNRNRFGPPPTAEEQALQKALDEKASPEDVKAKLVALREARKSKDAALEKAQDDLRKSLSPRQEAAAVLARLLK